MTVLASRPPAGSLFRMVLCLGVVVFVFLVFRFFISERARLLALSQAGLFWFRVGLLVGLGVVGLFALAAAFRIARRWMRPASIAIDGDVMVVRLPPVRRWWSMLDGPLSELSVPLAELRSLRVLTTSPAGLEIRAEHASVTIPGGVFAVGVHAIDAGIRAATGPGAWPHPLAPVETRARWDTSWIVRLAIPIVAIALIAAGSALFVAQAKDGGRLGFVPFILGIGLLISIGFYRGSIILDERGCFHERAGITTLIAWSELDPRTPTLRSHLGIWRELEIKAAATSAAGAQRIAVNQILWLGFPLKTIERVVRELRTTYR